MTRLTLLALLVCCCSIASALRFKDGEYMTMSKTRRTSAGVVRMRGFVGLSRRGGMAYAGGYAGARTEDSPAYASPGASAEDDEEDPEAVVTEDEDPQLQDDDEAAAPEPPPSKPARPSRARPQKPSGRPPRPSAEEEDDFGPPPNFGSNGNGGKGRGGATAIATSYSNGKGAVANSHAIAYDGEFTGGQFKHNTIRKVLRSITNTTATLRNDKHCQIRNTVVKHKNLINSRSHSKMELEGNKVI
ncbi:hypothetical protein B566_EDAN009164 [Ephemera danica]|nr:hypothetical protein B566_EDAN009164 [Ephemera danica]